jgi:hypothetical protein
MQGASPLWVQALIFVFGPPIMACLWWLLSRGTAMGFEGGRVSDRTKKREKRRFWILLCLMYAIVGGIYFYAHFIKH